MCRSSDDMCPRTRHAEHGCAPQIRPALEAPQRAHTKCPAHIALESAHTRCSPRRPTDRLLPPRRPWPPHALSAVHIASTQPRCAPAQPAPSLLPPRQTRPPWRSKRQPSHSLKRPPLHRHPSDAPPLGAWHLYLYLGRTSTQALRPLHTLSSQADDHHQGRITAL